MLIDNPGLVYEVSHYLDVRWAAEIKLFLLDITLVNKMILYFGVHFKTFLDLALSIDILYNRAIFLALCSFNFYCKPFVQTPLFLLQIFESFWISNIHHIHLLGASLGHPVHNHHPVQWHQPHAVFHLHQYQWWNGPLLPPKYGVIWELGKSMSEL